MKQIRKRHRYTKEEIDFIKDNYKKYYTPDLVNIFNKKFNTNINESSLLHIKCRYNLKSGLTGFRKGIHKRTLEQIENLMKARYEKCGAKIGHICKCGNYNYIKIKDEKFAQDNYMLYDRYLFEKHYGKIPKGYVIYHLDGNCSNNNINNLYAIGRGKLLFLMQKGICFKDKELNKTAIMSTDLLFKANKRRKELY